MRKIAPEELEHEVEKLQKYKKKMFWDIISKFYK